MSKVSEVSAEVEKNELEHIDKKKRSFLDYLALTVTTVGVGYLPLAPGTWGSIVGVLIYLLFGAVDFHITNHFLTAGWQISQITAWIQSINLVLFVLLCLAGIWAANRATILFKDKDPSQAVVDEVIGQLIVFLFIPFTTNWFYVLAGFIFFRIFDIWKPYPIDSLENLPVGIGICADDMLAGVYGGVCLSVLYAVGLTI